SDRQLQHFAALSWNLSEDCRVSADSAFRPRHEDSQAGPSVPTVSTSNLPCWLVEEFVVAEECAPCSNFQAKTTPECGSTGYVEKITCSSSKRSEFKSCRSALMEQRLFWKFEGAVIGLALVFACLVIVRQRQLDRKALEKVRKQIESI
uniref:Protein JTB n=1 Tax=Bos taurus TaxID=9913 RepID=F6QEW8_BOVIN